MAMLFIVLLFCITFKHNYAMRGLLDPGDLEKSVLDDTKTNILVLMAVDCNTTINDMIKSLNYNSLKFNVVWYFNIYNADKCDKTYEKIENPKNVHIISETISKVRFWIDFISPTKLPKIIDDVDKLDYIWSLDSDLLLDYFNVNGFIKLVQDLNIQIAQPSIIAKCTKCRASDWSSLNQISLKHENYDFSIIAKANHMVEMMAPIFTWRSWVEIYPLIEKSFENQVYNMTNWGPDLWWCSAMKNLSTEDEIACAIVHYTPIYHMNTQTIKKDNPFYQQGFESLGRQKTLYPDFFKEENRVKPKLIFVQDLLKDNNIDKSPNMNTVKHNTSTWTVLGLLVFVGIISTISIVVFRKKMKHQTTLKHALHNS